MLIIKVTLNVIVLIILLTILKGDDAEVDVYNHEW